MAERAVMLKRKGLAPGRILLLTFDNAAAASIREKLGHGVSRLQLSFDAPPSVSTLNAFGYSVLRDYVQEEYRPIAEDLRRRRIVGQTLQKLAEYGPDRSELLPKYLRHN